MRMAMLSILSIKKQEKCNKKSLTFQHWEKLYKINTIYKTQLILYFNLMFILISIKGFYLKLIKVKVSA